ncbi:UDP-N-acetylmuramate--L-alanine ligase [bacterium]|jgi:UDP-N-acetylmuramate--alanine ligase|nr:UDP-N-acetylmuramate--L-alanine ligase [bacterium]
MEVDVGAFSNAQPQAHLDSSLTSSLRPQIITSQSTTVDLHKITGPVHLAGIGGIGMSALARILLQRGHKVSGSDKAASHITEELKEMGAEIFIGHQAENLASAGALIISTAIVDGNPELEEAKRKGLPVWHRSELLAYLAEGDKMVAITGTHGKTTTTAMVGQALIECGLDPSIVVGGIFHHIGSNSRLGKGGYFVAESDESDGTHIRSFPHISVITNIEADHLENYPGGLEQILSTMVKFLSQTKAMSIVCTDDKGCRDLLERASAEVVKAKIVTYGTQIASNSQNSSAAQPNYGPDYGMTSLPGFEMQVYQSGKLLGSMTMKVPGEHNKMNALAAVAVAMELGKSFDEVSSALSTFAGVDRRFQMIGEKGGITVVDDYAHHPTEVTATLKAAQEYLRVTRTTQGKERGRVVCLFQPHQPARLRDLWQEFSESFTEADLVLLADVYIARGGKIEGIDSEHFVKAIKHDNAHHLSGPTTELATKLLPYLQPGDLLLTVGAGDVTNVGSQLLPLLQ